MDWCPDCDTKNVKYVEHKDVSDDEIKCRKCGWSVRVASTARDELKKLEAFDKAQVR